MKDETRAILILIVILMYAIAMILFFINLFNDSIGDDYFLRQKIFCALAVGATILSGIVKASGNNENDT